MWVGVCLHACACDSLLVHVGELLFLHHVHLLHLHAKPGVFTQAFLTSSNNDPYGSHHCDANLIHLEPAIGARLSEMKHLNTLSYLETCVWHPKTTFSQKKNQTKKTHPHEIALWSGWPLISFLLFIFRLWCDAAHVGGAALQGPRFRPTFMWSGPTWSGIWPGPVGPRLGAQSWSTASLECQTFEVRLVKKEGRLVGVWSNGPLCWKRSTDSPRGRRSETKLLPVNWLWGRWKEGNDSTPHVRSETGWAFEWSCTQHDHIKQVDRRVDSAFCHDFFLKIINIYLHRVCE